MSIPVGKDATGQLNSPSPSDGFSPQRERSTADNAAPDDSQTSPRLTIGTTLMTHTIPDYAKPYVPQAQTDWQLFDSICYAIKGTATEEEAAFGLRFMSWWKTINVECFESRLQPLFISREVSSYGHWIGLCQYTPTRHIKLAWAAFTAGHHEACVINRLPGFDDLSPMQHNAAMVVLHEMIHQSLFEAGRCTDHSSIGWAMLCRYLGNILGLPYDYLPIVDAKVPYLDDKGEPIKRPVFKEGEPVLLKNGNQKMEQVRYNVKKVSKRHEHLRDESKPLAPYEALYCFPCAPDSEFIKANTVTKTAGKAVEKNNGEPVVILPQF